MMKRLKNDTYIQTAYWIVDEDDCSVEMFETFQEARQWIKEQIQEGTDTLYGIVKVRQLCQITRYGYSEIRRFKVLK